MAKWSFSISTRDDNTSLARGEIAAPANTRYGSIAIYFRRWLSWKFISPSVPAWASKRAGLAILRYVKKMLASSHSTFVSAFTTHLWMFSLSFQLPPYKNWHYQFQRLGQIWSCRVPHDSSYSPAQACWHSHVHRQDNVFLRHTKGCWWPRRLLGKGRRRSGNCICSRFLPSGCEWFGPTMVETLLQCGSPRVNKI